jgi:hypothetical protein
VRLPFHRHRLSAIEQAFDAGGIGVIGADDQASSTVCGMGAKDAVWIVVVSGDQPVDPAGIK